MQVEWWYASGGTRKGPISTDVLRQKLLDGSVTTSDLVWTEGMSAWTAVCDVPVLNKMIQALPPELPKTAVSGPPEPFVDTEPSPFESPTPPPELAGPWRRFFARFIDLWLIALPTVFLVIVLLAPVSPGFAQWLQKPGSDYALGFLVTPLLLVVEAVVFAFFGTTIGKWILGIHITTTLGKTPTFFEYLSRQFGLYWYGLGTGFPLISLFTMARQRSRLKSGRAATYDAGQFQVTAQRIGAVHYVVATGVIAALVFVNALLSLPWTASNKSLEVATVTAPQQGKTFRDCPDCPEMVVIPAGSFLMGSNEVDSERPIHAVNVRSFAMGKYEVTQGQWAAVMGNNPSKFAACGVNCPVESVSWNEAQQFIQKLNQLTGKTYRLPSEAEWEYAARAGSSTRYWWGDVASRKYANYGQDKCCGGYAEGQDRWVETAPVGQFPANPFGMHDMHGNVAEWVEDRFNNTYDGAPSDGSVWMTGNAPERGRITRGGDWDLHPSHLRSSHRSANITVADSTTWTTTENKDRDSERDSTKGFRLARTVP
jgi:formylglycine-generating enzyme required for sulfatase activity/uncharacterized RDD family membrane protein YckC